MALNAKQKLFVKEYLIDKNATKAAERAKYSPRTARTQGSFLLTNPDIQTAIQTALDKTHKKLDISVERIQKELAGMAFMEMDGVAMTKGFKYSDKKGALELLGKNKGMFTDKVEVSGEIIHDIEVTIVKA